MGFVDKIIEKVGNKIQKIKQKRERKKIAKNLKEQLELIDGFRWWFSDKMLDLCNVPQEVRYPQCEFLIGKSLIRCLKSQEYQGSRIYYLEVVKKDYNKYKRKSQFNGLFHIPFPPNPPLLFIIATTSEGDIPPFSSAIKHLHWQKTV